MNQELHIYTQFLLIGILLTLFSFTRLLSDFVLFFAFLSCTVLFFYLIFYFFKKLIFLNTTELFLVYSFCLIWGLHFLQVLVPETGFDALWYHLPVAQKIIENKGLVYIPELYQSLNPLFADLYFVAGFHALGILGSKFVAYIFAVLFVLVSYSISKIFLPRNFSILVALIISTFQVVAWQSASFYVDVAKGFFELAGIYALLYFVNRHEKLQPLSLVFFSASLSSKLFSLFLVPAFIFIFGVTKFFSRKIFFYLLALFLVPTLYYSFSFIYTGNLFYSFTLHLEKLAEIGGKSDPLLFLAHKLSSAPSAVLLFISARDYVYPPLVVFMVIILYKIRRVLVDDQLKKLCIFAVSEWVLWWFIPPLSTRYAISGFAITLIIGMVVLYREYLVNSQKKKEATLLLLLFSVFILLAPRILVAQRSLSYILTSQTDTQYLQQFYDGSIDDKINAWYF